MQFQGLTPLEACFQKVSGRRNYTATERLSKTRSVLRIASRVFVLAHCNLGYLSIFLYEVFKVQAAVCFQSAGLYIGKCRWHEFLKGIWQPPALPHRLQCSTIGRLRLNRRVRDENGCFPKAHRHQISFVISLMTQQ